MKLKRAFTLMEVNLAMFVMAVGTLGLVSLYTLGYRENRQSTEDVAATAYAEGILNALTSALSSSEATWSQWNSLGTYPANGWLDYFDEETGEMKSSNPNGMAQTAFGAVMGKFSGSDVSTAAFDVGELKAALVIVHEPNARTCAIAFRAGKRAGDLMSQPMFYTEVHFQGDPNR